MHFLRLDLQEIESFFWQMQFTNDRMGKSIWPIKIISREGKLLEYARFELDYSQEVCPPPKSGGSESLMYIC